MANRKLITVLLTTGCLATADTLVLRNGRSIEGTYVGGDARSIRFDDGHSATTYNIGDVESVRFIGGSSNSAPGSSNSQSSTVAPWPAGAPTRSDGPQPATAGNSAYPQSPAPTNSSVAIPAGTQIVVRLIDPVNSEVDHLGQTYRVSLDEPVIVNGQTLIPRGADAVAFLIDSEHSGKIQGRTSLTLDLKTLTVNGRQYDVTTTGVSQASQGRGERSAKVIGGTAALGAVIGAIAGGGRGAAIGAGSGAAAGTAAQVLTSGQKVKIPSETRLTFTLQNPLNL
jgi:hypothetical protein